MRPAIRFVAAGFAAAGLMSAPIACFSERTSGPETGIEGCDVQLPPEAFGSTIVVMREFNFTPAQVNIARGSKVTWVNCDQPGSESHTSTADAGAWASPLIPPGTTFTRQFEAAGPLPYHCEPHPGMLGTVTVN